MNLNKFVTEYDEDLTGDVYIDPLGMLVIWSAFGEEVFQRRVNSISNDVRNYTLNLLNHALIRDLIEDDSVVLNAWLERRIGSKHSLSFRQACLVYLENVFTYVMVSAPIAAGVDAGGILGSTKARRRLEEHGGNPTLTLSHQGGAHLLVRQLGLGVSGRYKTPFMEIGFFDSNYHYHLPKAAPLWNKTHLLFKQSEPLGVLYREAKAHLVDLIRSATRKADVPPTLGFKSLPTSLIQAYRRALPSPARVGEQTRDFWLELTGLDQGAAGALLQVLDDQAVKKPSEPLPIGELFALAQDRCSGEQEAMKLRHIQALEPLLAETDLLFTLARHRKTQTTTEIGNLWLSLGRDHTTLPTALAKVEAMTTLQPVLSGAGLRRFKQLCSLAACCSMEEQLCELLTYHSKVMRSRGQFPWVEVTAGNRVKVHARTVPLPDRTKRLPGSWVNYYYIPQFRNLVAGYRGVAV